jgi:hypothetical protein
MRRRLIVAAVGAVALILLMSAPAFARHDAASAEPFGWDLQLRNTVSTQYDADMTYAAFTTWAAAHQVTIVDTNKTPNDTSDDTTYKGVALKTLVGYFDDQDPATFNAALATGGYNVVVVGMDGFTATFASADVASLGDKAIVANLANDAPLPVPKATLSNGSASWKPSWPLKIVSNESSVTGKMKPGGVVRVSIVAAVAPAASTEPFGWDLQLRNTMTKKYGADMTYKQWAAWAAKAGRAVTITDSTVPTATIAYKGVALKTLVGYFDDKNRSTFNNALAKKGYYVTILGMDGFPETFAAADIARLGNKVIVASLGNDAPLPVPKPFISSDGQPQWFPDWPLRVVSNVPAVGVDTKTQGIVRISIVKKPPAGLAPF